MKYSITGILTLFLFACLPIVATLHAADDAPAALVSRGFVAGELPTP